MEQKETQKKNLPWLHSENKDMESSNDWNGKKTENQLTQMATQKWWKDKIRKPKWKEFLSNYAFIVILIKRKSFSRLALFYDLLNLLQLFRSLSV